MVEDADRPGGKTQGVGSGAWFRKEAPDESIRSFTIVREDHDSFMA